MLPIFPEFVDLKFEHYKIIKKITENYLPYSDFNFVSLWSYNTKNEIKISVLNNNLVIIFTDYLTTKKSCSFFGKNKFEHTSITLLEFCQKNNLENKLILIPEEFANPKKIYRKITILPDRNNFDYIFLLEKIQNMYGHKFEKKRRLLHKFIRNHPGYITKEINLTEEKNKLQIFDLFNKWEKLKNKKREETSNELTALHRLMDHSHLFNLISIGLYNDNGLLGFTINEKVNDEYSIGHFSKADHEYEGINEALNKNTAEFLIRKNIKYINLEQDMGIENLRKSKLLWQPELFLKKYIISPIPPLHKRQ